MNPSTIRTPAKLNLGLEVIRRRPDGYHDLATIFQAVDIFDEFSVEPGPSLDYIADPNVPADMDIAGRALIELGAERGWTGRVRLTKRIPIAAGLGGGSSDAALILRLAALADPGFRPTEQAARIGADVAFFLQGGTALGTGIGDELQTLPTPRWWFVIAVPPLAIERKTASLFAGLTTSDFSDGARVRALAASLETGERELPAELPNAFARQMLGYRALAETWEQLRRLAGRVALSGAGPSLYSWHASEAEARRVADELRSVTPHPTLVARAIEPHSDEAALRAFSRVLTARAGRGTRG